MMMKREAEGREGVTSHTHTVEWENEREGGGGGERRESAVQCTSLRTESHESNVAASSGS